MEVQNEYRRPQCMVTKIVGFLQERNAMKRMIFIGQQKDVAKVWKGDKR